MDTLPEGSESPACQLDSLWVDIQAKQLTVRLTGGQEPGCMTTCAQRPIDVAPSAFGA